ncbi:hypothetical protein Q5O89_05195 [Peribacillus frigoritolerans]|nr:hypothetical protein [Peribacillus frigoritolerans]
MEISSLQEVSKLKANLLELADVLMNDKAYTREMVARDLVSNIFSLNTLESDFHKQFCKTGFMKIHKACDDIEDAREQKREPIKE